MAALAAGSDTGAIRASAACEPPPAAVAVAASITGGKSNATGIAPACPSQVMPVYIRVKRKRGEVALDHLLVHESIAHKRKRQCTVDAVTDELAGLSSSLQHKAASSVEPAVGGCSNRGKRRRSDVGDRHVDGEANTFIFKRVRRTCAGVDFVDRRKAHIIELSDPQSDTAKGRKGGIGSNATSKAAGACTTALALTLGSDSAAPARILTPLEQQMDKAIFNAFTSGPEACDTLLQVMWAGAPVDFQRIVTERTTALMAAAFNCRSDVVRELLDAGAKTHLTDVYGRTALDFARRAGHHPTILLLTDIEDTGGERKSESNDSASALQAEGGAAAPGLGSEAGRDGLVSSSEDVFDYYELQGPTAASEGGEDQAMDVLHIQSHYFSLFKQPELAYELVHDEQIDTLESDDGEAYDSNAEDAAGNDYPEEELTSGEEESFYYSHHRDFEHIDPQYYGIYEDESAQDRWYE